MSRSKRLVVLGGSLTALAVAREAWSRDVEVFVVSDATEAALRTHSAKSSVVDRREDGAALQTISALTPRGGAFLIATGDEWIRFVIQHRAELGRQFKILHASNETLEICLDKLAFAQWCAAKGLDTPRHWAGGSVRDAQDLTFPVLLRPVSTLHSSASPTLPKALEIADALQLRQWLDKYDAVGVTPLVTESLLGQELTQFSVPFTRRADGPCQSFVARKIRPPAHYCRVGSYVELWPDDGAERLVRRAIEALDYCGIGEAEVLYSADTGRYFLIEINARPWVQYALAPASGHDFLGIVMGDPVRPEKTPAKTGLRWIDFRSDLYICFSRSEGMFWHGELSVVEYLKSLAAANVYAKFDWRDLPPFFQDSVTLLRQVFVALLPKSKGKA